MSAPIPRFEAGGTREFVVTYSLAPGTTPYLQIHAGSGPGTLVHSVTGTASGTLMFFADYLLPASAQLMRYTWTASYTAGPVLHRGLFQVVLTLPG